MNDECGMRNAECGIGHSQFPIPNSEFQPAPVLAVTSGDPCGIGPEVILKSLARWSSRKARVIIIGDLRVFERTAKRLHRRLPTWHVVSLSHPREAALERGLSQRETRMTADDPRKSASALTFVDAAHRETFRPGRSGAAAGRASLDYLDTAMDLWRQGRAHAVVTAPVTKWAIGRVRRGFVGQTEYLAHACLSAVTSKTGQAGKASCPVMMFVSSRLRVVLLTRHLALRKVSAGVTRPLLRATLQVTLEGLRRYFGLRRPRIAICGLNPHAGEGGAFGREEQRILAPVLRALGRDRARIEGPFAADGFFAAGHRYDAVVCWYHDQGLIPFKMVARDRGCQLSLGLPFIRTSPDHGSALDIAGRGRAHPGSMRYALGLAATLARRTVC